jgi:hypothetical protein
MKESEHFKSNNRQTFSKPKMFRKDESLIITFMYEQSKFAAIKTLVIQNLFINFNHFIRNLILGEHLFVIFFFRIKFAKENEKILKIHVYFFARSLKQFDTVSNLL